MKSKFSRWTNFPQHTSCLREVRVSTESYPQRRKFSHPPCRDLNLLSFSHESGALTTELSLFKKQTNKQQHSHKVKSKFSRWMNFPQHTSCLREICPHHLGEFGLTHCIEGNLPTPPGWIWPCPLYWGKSAHTTWVNLALPIVLREICPHHLGEFGLIHCIEGNLPTPPGWIWPYPL